MKSALWLALAAGVWIFGFSAGAVDASALRNEEDGEFLMKAVEVSRQEVADAQVTAASTGQPEIKQTALSIARDHVKVGQAAAELVKQKGLNEPANESGGGGYAAKADSDPARIATLLKAHEEAVALFHQEAVRGMDPDVKRFARATLPTLQRRLKALRSLQHTYPEMSPG